MTTNNKLKLTYEDECYIWASSFYLSEAVEEDFFLLSDEARYKHLEEYAWEPFEFVDGYTIDGHIQALAAHLIDNTYPERNLWQRFTNCLQNKWVTLSSNFRRSKLIGSIRKHFRESIQKCL